MVVGSLDFGSHRMSPRCPCGIGNSLAEISSDPAWHHAGVRRFRTRPAAHTRACLSIGKLWTVVWLFQIASSPQYGDAAAGLVANELGVCGSRGFSGIRLVELVFGSSTVR